MNFWMALDLLQACLGLHMLPWTVHLEQTSGGSVTQPIATLPGVQHTKSSQHEPNFDLHKKANSLTGAQL